MQRREFVTHFDSTATAGPIAAFRRNVARTFRLRVLSLIALSIAAVPAPSLAWEAFSSSATPDSMLPRNVIASLTAVSRLFPDITRATRQSQSNADGDLRDRHWFEES